MNTIYDLLVSKLSDAELSELKTAAHEEYYLRMANKAKRMSPMTDDECAMISKDGRMEAIKAYNRRTGVGLLVSRAVIDNYIANV